MMSILTSFKLVISKKSKSASPLMLRRAKLGNKIFDQIQLAKAQKEGRTYAPTRMQTFTNKETGERKVLEKQRRVREWWHVADGGKIHLICKYGSKPIHFDSKGKNAIEVANTDELLTALESLKLAVEQGELDTQIEATSGAMRASFLK